MPRRHEDKMKLHEKVRSILFLEWDPLCVSSNEHLSGEYDDYIPEICFAISTFDPSVIEKSLLRIEQEKLGMSVTDSRRKNVVGTLLAIVK